MFIYGHATLDYNCLNCIVIVHQCVLSQFYNHTTHNTDVSTKTSVSKHKPINKVDVIKSSKQPIMTTQDAILIWPGYIVTTFNNC